MLEQPGKAVQGKVNPSKTAFGILPSDNYFPISIPPLRDRLDDILLLADFFVEKISKRMGKSIFTPLRKTFHALSLIRPISL
jgi:transcriptional regulator with AAA-type ATPase domain